jgi:multicomponent Na+:H+ antiporter subunit B
MSVVVRTAARPAMVILGVAGVYLAAWGYTPGGGFPAGVIVTGIAILAYVALGRGAIRPVVRPKVLEPVEMLAAAAIALVGIFGLVRHHSLFANWLPLAQPQTIFAGGNQQLYSALELVEVAVSLTIAVFALLGMGHDWTPDEGQKDESEE